MLPNEKPYKSSLYLADGIIYFHYVSKTKFNVLL